MGGLRNGLANSPEKTKRSETALAKYCKSLIGRSSALKFSD